jgi:hypothetical protein
MNTRYIIIHIVRTIYVLFSSILAMNIVLFVAMIVNATPLFPNSFYHNWNLHNVKLKIWNLFILFFFITMGYLFAEYISRKRIAFYQNESSVWTHSKKYILFISYLYFFAFSFLNFLITLHFISNYYPMVLICTTLLNAIPIYLISTFMLSEIQIRHIKTIFWITTLVMSVAMVFPFGSILLPCFIRHLLF